ncbi:retinal short-chain dehydrogenase/reductase [Cantharellus anzutake]|uniref:retinal short-chain dehydrogenase/reductase n=1 Tax=Cantharellus anzutake TaxID=1750568 RepID=UPI001905227D|nr:retinal short-chain dehydrogenase/reductase [Cantharellus anzutake]KAF8342260.1 retinal short-chain dehydrogenase/reductase [Cantharellus anzutake]
MPSGQFSDIPETLGVLDVDVFIKVLSRTLFSPFFTAFIPLLVASQRQQWDAPAVKWSAGWFFLLSMFWSLRFISKLWRNGGSLLYQSARTSWENQIVLITGGASGTGELLANTLAVRNVDVVVLDVNPIVSENYNVHYYKCDISNWEEVNVISKRIIEEVGQPTIVVNNAGVVQGKPLVELSAEDINQTFAVNTLGHFWVLKAFLPGIVKQRFGHIVTVSSVTAFAGIARMADYCASKSAVISLHESLRYELDKIYRTPQIRTTLVTTGFIHTPLFSRSSYAATETPSPLPAWLFHFFAPPLDSHEVVKAIIAALDANESTDIKLPFYAHLVALSRVFPSWVRDVLQWVILQISGADYMMENFVKVSGLRGDEEVVNDEGSKEA